MPPSASTSERSGPSCFEGARERLLARPHLLDQRPRRRGGAAARAALRRSRWVSFARTSSGSGSSLPGSAVDDVDPLARRRRRVGDRARPVERVHVAGHLGEADVGVGAAVGCRPARRPMPGSPCCSSHELTWNTSRRRPEAVVGGEHDRRLRARRARRCSRDQAVERAEVAIAQRRSSPAPRRRAARAGRRGR